MRIDLKVVLKYGTILDKKFFLMRFIITPIYKWII